MNVELALERIGSLAESMMSQDQDENMRAISFAAIRALAGELDEVNESSNDGNGYVAEKIGDILWHAAAIARLDEGNGHPEDQHLVWLMGTLNGLGSPCALGSVIERQRQESPVRNVDRGRMA